LYGKHQSASNKPLGKISSINFIIMAYTIVTDVCEGIADCAVQCPVACIHEGGGANIKGTSWYWIDFAVCIDCGVCLAVCPVQGAVLPEERPNLQKTPL
jgi:NAD-dependent dihydropyrimidine dehydrogenase PreA subunit